MTVDRYTKALLTVIAIASSAIAVHLWLGDALPAGPLWLKAAEAQAPPKYEVTIPKAWGKLVGFSNNNLLLEGPDQALRIVDVEGRAPEYPKVKTLVRWQ